MVEKSYVRNCCGPPRELEVEPIKPGTFHAATEETEEGGGPVIPGANFTCSTGAVHTGRLTEPTQNVTQLVCLSLSTLSTGTLSLPVVRVPGG